MKKIMITSGGTSEYIDDVRVLTNISTGKLGALIAEKFSHDFEVYYVYSKNAILPTSFPIKIIGIQITDVETLYNVMEQYVPLMDIVIHAMAVSDFGFSPIKEKLKSSDPEAFIESMRKRIKKNPKILPLIKKWNPGCKLISFKFEVGLKHDDLIKIATDSMINSNSDIVIANDKQEMVNNSSHIAYAIDKNKTEVKLNSKTDIVDYLYKTISKDELINVIDECFCHYKNDAKTYTKQDLINKIINAIDLYNK